MKNLDFTHLNSFNYQSKYGSSLLRGKDDPHTPRPWDLTSEIVNAAMSKNSFESLLDIGCGTAYKLVPLASYFKTIYGLEPNLTLLKEAKNNVQNHQNIKLIKGIAEHLPFTKNSFDVVTSMIAAWDAEEIHRVLKPHGVVILERVGCEDKKDLKLLFGEDQFGLRGVFSNFTREEYINFHREKFAKFFNSVEVREGYWHTFYSNEGLIELLKFAPIIRNFDFEKDRKYVEQAIEKFSTEQGVKLTQNRLLIIAKNNREATK